jgi:thymidylate synthase (FAD)
MGLEQIKIELVDSMGNDLSTVNSARVSFDKESKFLEEWDYDGNCPPEGFTEDDYYDMDIEKGMSGYRKLKEGDKKLIKYLADHKHMTPFRHNQIQIRCHAPIFLARQLGKHQSGLSWNEVSRRYVDSEPEFYIPDEWRGRPDGSIKQGSGGVVKDCNYIVAKVDYNEEYGYRFEVTDSIEDVYAHLINESIEAYEEMLSNNVAPEMARMILPQSMMTTWWWTGNLLAFAHVYKERVSSGAQLEAQHFAKELDKVIRPLYPESWQALVGGVSDV